MWVPLAELTRGDTFREELWDFDGGRRPMFFFELDDETIWGATARHPASTAAGGPGHRRPRATRTLTRRYGPPPTRTPA